MSAVLVAIRNEVKAKRALALLAEARDLLKQAEHRQTLRRVRYAISSAKGAVRIAGDRVVRAQLSGGAPACAEDPDGQHFVGCGCVS